MSGPVVSLVCPVCEQRSTKHVCARCALTTAEERDAARAEVARLTALVGEARRLIRDLMSLLGGDDDLPYPDGQCDCTVCVGGRAFLAKSEATDAAT